MHMGNLGKYKTNVIFILLLWFGLHSKNANGEYYNSHKLLHSDGSINCGAV